MARKRRVPARNQVSGATLARQFGISRQAIHAARKAGRLTVASTNERGWPLYDVDDARTIFAADIGQVARPGCMRGGRPAMKAVFAREEVDDRAAIAAAAVEARQWLATATTAEITARRAEILDRMRTLAARHRRYRDRTGTWPTLWPSWRAFGQLELELFELDGIDTGKVPD